MSPYEEGRKMSLQQSWEETGEYSPSVSTSLPLSRFGGPVAAAGLHLNGSSGVSWRHN